MKKLVLASAFVVAAASALFASAEAKDTGVKAGEVEKKGVLATEECIKKGYFRDCRLDTTTNSPMALYVHSEGITYKLDASSVSMHELDEGIGKNNVTIIGTLGQGNTIKIRTYKAPPPEGKSFFKGCL